MDFTDQHVVITGGSTGIGRATAEKIVGAGGKVTLIARRPEVLEQAARAIGPNASWIAADAGDKEALVAALDGAVGVHGPIDGLFLNAAVNGAFSLTPDYSDEAFDEVMRVNAFSLFWAVRHVLPACVPPLTVLTTSMFGWVLLSESALSFLGLGVPPPAPSWGGMLADSRATIEQAPWLGVLPGLSTVEVSSRPAAS